MNKEELIGKLQMVYVGDRNALNELIGYYDGLKQGIEQLQQENKILKENAEHNDKVVDKVNWENNLLKQQNKKYKEVIDKIKEYIESKNNGNCIVNGKNKGAYTFVLDFDKAREFIWELLDILKEVE